MSAQIDRTSMNSLRVFLAGISKDAPKAMTRALNATVSKGRTESSKAIRAKVNLQASYIKKRMNVKKANYRNLQASISTPSRGVLLSRFATNRQVSGDKVSWMKPPEVPKRGIRVKVSPGSGTKVVTGGDRIVGKPFYMVLPNTNRVAIVGRRAKRGKKGGNIEVLYAPSVSQVFTDVIGEIQGPMNDYLAEQLSKQVDAIFRGY